MAELLAVGGGGMIGQKLASRLASTGLNGDRSRAVVLFDVGYPERPAPAAETLAGDFRDGETVERLVARRPDPIFLLAAVVSGEAERDYGKGWSTNLFANWQFVEAVRKAHEASGGDYRPRIVFTSTIAVFGPPFPDPIGDEFLAAPQTSYGAQKACVELILADASRKGYVDAVSIRLPTICVRPGKPNLAASGFFSGIIREPLNGLEAQLPVPDSVRHWHASPRAAVDFLLRAAALDTRLLDGRRTLNMPGVSCTVGEQIEALGRVAGSAAVRRIRRVEDPAILKIVEGWPRNFDAARARSLGFEAEASFDEIVRVYVEDELDGRIPG